MKKFNCTLCMSGSSSLIFSIGNVLLGIKKHSPNLFDRIVIYTEILPENDKKALKGIFDYVEIVEYSPQFNPFLAEIYSDSTNKGARMPCFVYADFEIFNLIKDSKKVVYLDSDVLIKGDISSILNYVDEQSCIAMRKIAAKLDVAVGTKDPILSKLPFYNAGVIVINEHEKFSNFANECYKVAAEYAKTNAYCDQSSLTIACHRNNIKISRLPVIYNNNINCSDCFNNVIVHQNMKAKFWNQGVVNALFPEWNENDEQWRTLGGTPFSGVKYRWEYKDLFKKGMKVKLNNLVSAYEILIKQFFEKLSADLLTRKIILNSQKTGTNSLLFTVFKNDEKYINVRITSSMLYLIVELQTSYDIDIKQVPDIFLEDNKIGFKYSESQILFKSKYNEFIEEFIRFVNFARLSLPKN